MLLGTEDGNIIMRLYKQHGCGSICETMLALDVLSMDDDRRVSEITARRGLSSRLICTGESGISWWAMYGAVWCVRSSTQCDYCGPVASFEIPKFAKVDPDWKA